MPPERYTSIVDVHMLLRRGGKILLLRRAGDTWASGQLCLPSGHVEEGESIRQAVIRETEEECGLAFAPESLRLALSIHQRNPGTRPARIGFAFGPPGHWDGQPVNAEPHKHSELIWADPSDLPPDTVDYTAAIIGRACERRSTTRRSWPPAPGRDA